MTTTYRSADDLFALREHVHECARARRGGVFRRSDLPGWDVDPRLIPVMLRRRWWTRLHHGVYADSRALAEATSPGARHQLHAAAAVLAIEGESHLFAVSAALMHDLPFDRAVLDRVHIVRPLGTDTRALRRRITARDHLEDPVVHQHALASEDVTVVDGVPVVSRELTALSTAALSNHEWAVVTMDGACWQSPQARERIGELVESWPRLLGIGTVRRAFPFVRTGAQTPLESLSRLAFLRQGLPEPELQAPLHDADGLIGYADMLWDELGVVGEADGALKYTSGDVLFAEKVREDRIRALGFVVVRWTWDEILRYPDRVANRIRAAGARQRTVAR